MPKEVRVDLVAGQVLRVFSATNLKGGINSSKRTATLTATGTYVEDVPPPLADPAPTVIAGPTVSDVTKTGVTVAWTVSEVATGQVEYRLKAAATSTLTAPELSFDYSTHRQAVTGLKSCTAYELRVIGKDKAGQSYASAWKGFQTDMHDCQDNPNYDPDDPTSQPTIPAPPPILGGTIGYPPDTILSYRATNGDTMPGYLSEITDSTWGTKIRRVSNVDGRVNQYAKHQAWNKDGTRIWLFGARLLNGTTYADLGAISADMDYAVWSNINPDYLYGVRTSTNTLKRYSVAGATNTNASDAGFKSMFQGVMTSMSLSNVS